MEKWLKYSLSGLIILFVTITSCNKVDEKPNQPDESEQLSLKRERYYQGSVYSQINYDALITIEPNNAGIYQGKSIPHTKIGDYHIAFPLLEKAYELDPKETGYYYGWLLLYYYRDYERAIKKLNEFDDFTPNQPDFAWGEHVNYLKGLCYKQMGQFDKAIDEFDKVIELEGDYVDVYAFVYRGICKMMLGFNKGAVVDFEKAIANYPNNSMAYFYLGMVHERSGTQILSKKAYQNALRLLKKGFLNRDPYYEVFDAVSIEMVEDYLAKTP